MKNIIKKIAKIETSKKLLVASFVMAIVLMTVAIMHAWRTFDSTVYIYLIPAVFAELATATGFYYSKAKAENKIKLAALLKKQEDNLGKSIYIDEVAISDKTNEENVNNSEYFETTDDPFKEA